MSNYQLTKQFRLEMAHALVGYDGLCNQIHGHSYLLEVTVEGEPSESEGSDMGMAVDFGTIRRIVDGEITSRYDHSLLLRDCPETAEVVEVLRRHFDRIHAVSWQPTCENILAHFASLIEPHLPVGIRLHSLRLHETAANCATYLPENRI